MGLEAKDVLGAGGDLGQLIWGDDLARTARLAQFGPEGGILLGVDWVWSLGQGGQMLKKIGTAARQEIEAMSGRTVFLNIRVKVRKDWRDNEKVLSGFGY